jgi:hypothetical protein
MMEPALVFTATTESGTASAGQTDPASAAAAALGLDPEFIVVDPDASGAPDFESSGGNESEANLIPANALEAESIAVHQHVPELSDSLPTWIQETNEVLPTVHPSIPVVPEGLRNLEATSISMSASPDNSSPAPKTTPLPIVPAEHFPVSDSPRTNSNESMKKENQAFDKIVIEVARIIFGDENLTELNLRLVRMALERHHVDQIVTGPATA